MARITACLVNPEPAAWHLLASTVRRACDYTIYPPLLQTDNELLSSLPGLGACGLAESPLSPKGRGVQELAIGSAGKERRSRNTTKGAIIQWQMKKSSASTWARRTRSWPSWRGVRS